MGKHRIKIRIPGENEFIEEFRGASAKAAEDRARIHYPDAAKTQWMGQAGSSAKKERQDDTYTAPRAAGGMDQPHQPASSGRPQREYDPEAAGDALATLWFLFKWWFIIACVIGFAPFIAGGCTGKVANKMTRGKGLKVRVAVTFLSGAAAFFGTAMIQKEFQPQLHQDRMDAIQNIFGGDKKEEAPSAPVVIPETIPETDDNQPQETYNSRAGVDPCKIWADANPTLAAELQPGDRCWGF